MKNKQYRESKTVRKLKMLRNNGVEQVEWRLKPEVVEIVKKYFYIEPSLYEVKTRKMVRIHEERNSIIKKIHYSYKGGKSATTMSLSEADKAILDSYGIQYRPCKYLIRLRE